MTDLLFRPRRRRRRAMLNVTSLIDVLFLLLIFFMLTSTFRRSGQLTLSLPESSTASPLPAGESQAPLRVSLLEDGRVLVGDAPVEESELLSILRKQAQANPGSKVLLQAEAATRHADVVRILDLIREAGFAGVSIGTEMRAFQRGVEPHP
jgi:biopolymer transport protein ExbD